MNGILTVALGILAYKAVSITTKSIVTLGCVYLVSDKEKEMEEENV